MKKTSELRSILHSKSISSFSLRVLPAYERLWPEFIEGLRNEIRSLASQGAPHPQTTDEQTTRRFVRIWTRNALGRIFFASASSSNKGQTQSQTDAINFIKNISTEDSEESFAKRSVASRTLLYCGAGPGLEQELRAFGVEPHARPSCMVVASDTALPFLLRKGYHVDLCISIDAGFASRWHFSMLEQIPDLRLPLPIPVLTWLAGPTCLESYFQKILLYRSSFPVDQILGHGPLSQLPEWKNLSRNVSGLALLLAASQGFSEVCLLGSNFTTQAGKSHVAGTGYELYALCKQNRLNGLCVYQPATYAKLSEKNRQALLGLEAMARNLSLTLRWSPLGEEGPSVRRDSSDTQRKPHRKLSSEAPTSRQRQIQTLSLERRKLLQSLRGFLETCDAEIWKEIGLPLDWLDKSGQWLTRRTL